MSKIEINVDSAIKSINLLNEEVSRLKKNIETSSKVNKTSFDNLEKGINGVKTSTKNLRLEEIKLEQKREKAFDKYEKGLQREKKARESQITKESALRERLSAQRKKEEAQTKREKEALVKLNSEYNIQQKKLAQLKITYGDLAIKKELNGKLSKKEEILLNRTKRALDRKDAALKRVDAQMGVNTRHVGNYKKSLLGLGKSLVGAFGVVSGVMIFAQVMRSVVKTVGDFDKSMVDLSAVLGVSREELSGLEDVIKDVASASTKTANEVADLASTLATLGKTKTEIEDLLKPVNDLGIALDATSSEAGELLIQTLNAFGKSTKSAEEFADVIAKMRTSTALDFQRIQDALGYLAPTAKAVGLTFAETGSILGVLVDNGIKSARAGRIMSSSFIKMATEGITLNKALEDIRNSQDKVVTSGRIFGKQGAALGLILADNKDKMASLTEEFDNAGGSLEDLTNNKMKSLTAQIKILESEWTDLILSMESGDGILSKLATGGIAALSSAMQMFRFNMDLINVWFDNMVISINVVSKGFKKLIPFVDDSVGLFQEQADAIRNSAEQFTNLGTDLGVATEAQTKLNEAIEDYNTIISGGSGMSSSTNSYGKALDDLKEKLKLAKEELNEVNVTDTEGIIAKKRAIKKIEDEIKALKDLGKALKVIIKDKEKINTLDMLTSEEMFDKEMKKWKNIQDAIKKTYGLSDDPTGDFNTPTEPIVNANGESTTAPPPDDGMAWQDWAMEAQDALNAVGDLGWAIFDARIQRIDAEIDAETEKYDKLLALAKGDEAETKIIERNKALRLKKLDEEKKKEKIKQAKFDKAVAINMAIINTAVGVTAAAPVIPLMVLTAVLGAVEIATIAATPIPAFATGGIMDHDGVALINDGGNKEYVERNGQILSTSNENALVNLEKGDIIHKDYDTMIRKSMIMNGAIGGSMVSGENYDGIEMAIDRGFKKAKINNSISVLNESNSYENEMTTWN